MPSLVNIDSNECESENNLGQVDREARVSFKWKFFIRQLSAGTGRESINSGPRDRDWEKQFLFVQLYSPPDFFRISFVPLEMLKAILTFRVWGFFYKVGWSKDPLDNLLFEIKVWRNHSGRPAVTFGGWHSPNNNYCLQKEEKQNILFWFSMQGFIQRILLLLI